MSLATKTSYIPKNFMGGEHPPVFKQITLAAGEGALAESAVLARITKGAATGARTAANTGNAAIGTVSRGAAAKVGVYTIVCITAHDDGPPVVAAVYRVIDPDGIRLADAVEGAAYAGSVNFTITAGDTDTAAGDSFTVTVAAGSGYYKRVNKADTDGGAKAVAVLASAVTVPADAVAVGVALIHGEPNSGTFSYDDGTVLADVQADLEAAGIYPKTLA